MATRMVEATGIPHGYSASVAWFAERMILAALCLAVLSFGAGIIFAIRLAEPIVSSQFYNSAVIRTQYAQRQVVGALSPVFLSLLRANRSDEQLAAEERAAKKEKLRAYLASKKSPFAKDEAALDAFVDAKNMKMMLAISFVESTFGQRCWKHNFSGIGGSDLVAYKSYADWIRAFDALLEKRYKNLPPEEYLGLYVQPGSPNWIYGVNQVLAELEEQGIA